MARIWQRRAIVAPLCCVLVFRPGKGTDSPTPLTPKRPNFPNIALHICVEAPVWNTLTFAHIVLDLHGTAGSATARILSA